MINHISMYTHNKVLLSLFLCFLHIGVMKAEEKTVTIDFGSVSAIGAGYGEYNWTRNGLGCKANCARSDFYGDTSVRFGNNNSFSNTSQVFGYIKSIKITPGNHNTTNSTWYVRASKTLKASVSNYDYVSEITLNKTTSTICEFATSKMYHFFYLTVSTSCYIQSITITYEVPSLTLVAHTADTYYATFSNSESVFFPRSAAEVMAVDVAGTSLVYNPLELKTGMHVGDQMMDGYVVPKNTGVLLSSADTSIPYYYYSTTESTMPDNKLQPASKTMSGDYLFYKLAYNDYEKQTDLGFYWGANEGAAFEIKSGTAYLQVPKTTAAKVFLFDSQADGISRVEEPKQHDGSVYDLQGNRISKLQRGINIVNGKKVYVR